jgi:thiol-disulfide isomerase/thioredoxin
MRDFLARASGALMLLLVAACGAEPPSRAAEPAIPFELERLGGSRVALSDLQGKFVLIDFWATWCPPCVLEIPELNAFYEEHRGSGVEVLAVSVDDLEPGELEAWAEEHGIAYPVALGDEELARRYGATAFPYHVFLSPDGRVIERLDPGYHDRSELAEVLERHRGNTRGAPALVGSPR